MEFTFPAVGIVHSCFKEKFGIPRQPGLAPLACAQLELLPPYDDPAALEGLEGCSHLWLQFVFHANRRESWKPRVRPPRLGGNKQLGVFATRSPVRPDRKSTRLNSSHVKSSYAVFCLKKKNTS